MDYIAYIVVAVVGLMAGWHIRGVLIMSYLSENPDKMIEILNKIKAINAEEAKATADSNIVELEIETVGNTLYAYSKNTNQFIAQGPDINSILEIAKQRFPSVQYNGTINSNNSAKEVA